MRWTEASVVPTSPESEERLKASPASKAKRSSIVLRDRGSPAKIETSAYEPSARSRALLHGVEIAESVLREAGGAFELEEVQRLLHGVTRQAVEKL